MIENKTTCIIAEIAQAHDGSLGILHSYIDALADTGIDAIKFQTHIAHAESSLEEPFRINFSFVDKTRFDYWKRMEFSIDQWAEIKAHCEDVGLEFMSSPFSQAAVDLLEELNVKRYKIGSGEVNNLLMLEKIAKTGKPIILSSGMSSLAELDEAVAFINRYGNNLAIMQCTTSYPTPPEELGLNVIKVLKDRYPNHRIGLSEHTGSIYSSIAAFVLGAELLEFHAVFNRKMFGPDASSSLEIQEIKEIVAAVRYLEKSFYDPIDKSDNSAYFGLKKIFEKSLAINKSVKKGHVINFDDLEAKKPADKGIEANRYKEVIGRKVNKPLSQWDFITWDLIEDN